MDKKPYKKKKRLYRRLMLALAVVLVMIAAGFLFLARNMRPVLTQKLKDQVVRSSDSLYRITFRTLGLNLYTGSITISDFRLIPDTAVYERLKALHVAPENLFDVSVQRLELNHAHPFRLFLKKEVRIKEIRINHPVIKILHEDIALNDTTQSLEQIMRNLISGPLNSIRINRIGLNNISISYKNNSNPQARGFSLDNADMVFKELAIAPETIHDTTLYFYSKDMWVHLTDLKMPVKNSLYTLYLKDIAYSTQQQTALIKGFSVETGLSDAAFDRASGIQKDKISFEADSIQLNGLNIINIMYKRKIGTLRSLSLTDGTLDVYRNRDLPEKKELKPLPQGMLRRAAEAYLMQTISAKFTLDTVHLDHVNITYREHNPDSRRTGEVSFTNTRGAFYNITNDSLQLRQKNHARADLQALFMGKGKVRVHFDFNLTDPADIFSYSGHLSTMKATALNSATRNLGLVSIRSGVIDKLDLNFNADDRGASGTVGLLYQDLNVKLLSLDESSGSLKNKGIASLLTNILVLKNNNIEGPDPLQEASVYYTRDKYKSMFNLMWKSVFEGVKSVLGMDQKSDSHLKESLKNNKFLDKIKSKKNNK